MSKKKSIKERGKVRLSEYFKTLNKGDKIALKKEKSIKAGFPDRFQGLSGVVVGKRGRSYIVKIKDFKKEKTLIISPIHLRKLK
ncbi:MAG: 50S ribosomal protein L21e [Candidatus Pacearchaeota archaeon]